MPDNTIFFTELSKEVRNALDARKYFYSKEDRGGIHGTRGSANKESAHNWMYKKMAYCEVQAFNENQGVAVHKATLLPAQGGGLGRKGTNNAGLYRNITEKSEKTNKFYPKPTLSSVKMSAEGDFGSIRKCEIRFQVHTLNDLASVQPFFDLGADIKINYGWNPPSAANGPQGKFNGKIYNFSYQVNENGGFDCTTYAMAPGMNILGGYIDAPITSEFLTCDAAGNERAANNLIEVLIAECRTELHGTAINEELGISLSMTLNPEESLKNYVSLEHIVSLINQLTSSAGGDRFIPLKLVCNTEITRGKMPTGINTFCSANPNQCLFPGYCRYTDETKDDIFFGSYEQLFRDGDLSKIMFSIDWLKEVFDRTGNHTIKGQKSSDSSISRFLFELFDSVYKNSGEKIQLATVSNPKNQQEMLVVDIKYSGERSKIYELTAVRQDSICRNVSLQSKVPNELAITAFIANSAGLTGFDGEVLSTLFGKASDNKNVDIKIDDNIPNLAEAKKALISNKMDSSSVKALQAALKNTRLGIFKDAVKNYYKLGVPGSNLSFTPTGITESNNSNNTGPTDLSKIETIPFPIDFSATLDGIDGIVFGNTVTCNYLPQVYRNPDKVAFTITRVEHDIQNNDWSTTLHTACRLIYND